jgi:hypothetical protein
LSLSMIKTLILIGSINGDDISSQQTMISLFRSVSWSDNENKLTGPASGGGTFLAIFCKPALRRN